MLQNVCCRHFMLLKLITRHTKLYGAKNKTFGISHCSQIVARDTSFLSLGGKGRRKERRGQNPMQDRAVREGAKYGAGSGVCPPQLIT